MTKKITNDIDGAYLAHCLSMEQERNKALEEMENTENSGGIKADCDSCGKRIEKQAALMFSPPDGKMVQKYHICEECWPNFAAYRKP